MSTYDQLRVRLDLLVQRDKELHQLQFENKLAPQTNKLYKFASEQLMFLEQRLSLAAADSSMRLEDCKPFVSGFNEILMTTEALFSQTEGYYDRQNQPTLL